MTDNTAIYIYVGVSIVIMGVLSVFLINCNNKSCSPYTPSDICICGARGQKLCTNRNELIKSYEQGNTEYQEFHKSPNYWASTNFDQY